MNKALLRYEMAKKQMSVGQLTVALGMSKSAFWRKCNGISEFKQKEIKAIIDILELEHPEDIFFTD